MKEVAKDPKGVFSCRIKKSSHQKLKEIGKKAKVPHTVLVEVLVEKLIRGEIPLLPKDFDI